MSQNSRNRFFYGYWIIFAGFVTTTLMSGFSFYGFSVLNKPIGDEFDWSRSGVATAFFIYSITFAVVSLLVGRITDRRGPRQVLFVGALTMSLALILLSRTTAIWNFYFLHMVLGIGTAFLGPAPVSVNISNWFYRLPGTMQGLAFTGIGVGGLAVAPLLGNYIIPSLGWRGAYVVMAVLLLVIMLPLIIFVVKDYPHQKGLRPYGKEAIDVTDNNGSDTEEANGCSFKEATGTLAFWIIVLTSTLYGMSMTGAIQNQVSIMTEQNFTAGEAMVALGGIGLFSAVGKLLFGYLCDNIDPKYATAICYILVASSLVAMIQANTIVYVWIYAALMGLGMGGWAPNLAMLAVRYFGLKNLGSVLGALHMSFLAGEAIGPVVAGFVYDQTGSYRLILMVFSTLCLISIPVMVIIRRPRIPTLS
ncbi:MFS transporter [Bacteroidota bacterium]